MREWLAVAGLLTILALSGVISAQVELDRIKEDLLPRYWSIHQGI